MKTYNKILTIMGVALSAAVMSSCTGDLDLLPNDPHETTPATFAQDPAKYMEETMADVYLQMATHGVNNDAAVQGLDGGMSSFQRASFILEEVPSDEANWMPNDADYGTFQYGIVPANNRVIFGTYSRYMINVTLANQFIQTVKAGYFGTNMTPELQARADEYIRQCKTIRSMAYFYLIDCFGNPPYADENVAVGSIPPQLSSDVRQARAQLFDLVTATLEEVVAEYNDADANQPYGYVGRDAAEALLVRYYLNAQVYTGTPQWDKCITHARNIIQRHQGKGFQGSGLANTYHQLFGANNDRLAIGGADPVNEILWTIPQDATNLLSWANGTFMLDAWIGDNTTPGEWNCTQARYNAGDSWKCMTARRQFVEIFDWDANYFYSPDQRTAYWCTAADNFDINNGVLDQAHYGSNGFLPVKFTNWNFDSNGELSANQPTPTSQISTDYPLIRLAEVYLSAAEALLQQGSGQAEALKYVNYIRQRAGMEPYQAINLGELRNERCRELYTECLRRSDLIRYGQWVSGYTWNWKNQVPTGADFRSNFDLYPLPAQVVTDNGYVQNPGY